MNELSVGRFELVGASNQIAKLRAMLCMRLKWQCNDDCLASPYVVPSFHCLVVSMRSGPWIALFGD